MGGGRRHDRSRCCDVPPMRCSDLGRRPGGLCPCCLPSGTQPGESQDAAALIGPRGMHRKRRLAPRRGRSARSFWGPLARVCVECRHSDAMGHIRPRQGPLLARGGRTRRSPSNAVRRSGSSPTTGRGPLQARQYALRRPGTRIEAIADLAGPRLVRIVDVGRGPLRPRPLLTAVQGRRWRRRSLNTA